SYRMRVVPLFLPPLRHRQGDVEALFWHFVEEMNQRGPRRVEGGTRPAMDAILSYPWPGNVRELPSAVEGAFVGAEGRYRTSPTSLPTCAASDRPGRRWKRWPMPNESGYSQRSRGTRARKLPLRTSSGSVAPRSGASCMPIASGNRRSQPRSTTPNHTLEYAESAEHGSGSRRGRSMVRRRPWRRWSVERPSGSRPLPQK